jgi:hypothetical protein
MKASTNKTSEIQRQLLDARKQNLEEQVIGSLRSHGKLWGMDVFSWYKPSLYELENTLSSFPAPICWLANENDILNLLKEETYWINNVKLICSYDRAGFKLPNKILDSVDDVLGAAEINDALFLLRSLKKSQGILLFTSSGENWAQYKQSFEAFLDIHQA